MTRPPFSPGWGKRTRRVQGLGGVLSAPLEAAFPPLPAPGLSADLPWHGLANQEYLAFYALGTLLASRAHSPAPPQ